MKLYEFYTITNGISCTLYECTFCITLTAIDNTKVFYENYSIEPKGLLFGNNQCELNNYSNFMTFTP
jgi:hypothetical protein